MGLGLGLGLGWAHLDVACEAGDEGAAHALQLVVLAPTRDHENGHLPVVLARRTSDLRQHGRASGQYAHTQARGRFLGRVLARGEELRHHVPHGLAGSRLGLGLRSWLRLGLGQGLGLRLGLGLGEGVGLGSRVVQGACKVLYARSASPPTEPVRPKMHAYLLYRCGVHRQERRVSWQGVRVGGRAVG